MPRKRLAAILAAMNAKHIAILSTKTLGSGHVALAVTDGRATARVVVAATPSCHRAQLNAVGNARRALRQVNA